MNNHPHYSILYFVPRWSEQRKIKVIYNGKKADDVRRQSLSTDIFLLLFRVNCFTTSRVDIYDHAKVLVGTIHSLVMCRRFWIKFLNTNSYYNTEAAHQECRCTSTRRHTLKKMPRCTNWFLRSALFFSNCRLIVIHSWGLDGSRLLCNARDKDVKLFVY